MYFLFIYEVCVGMKVRRMKLSEIFNAIRLQKQYWLFPSFFYYLARGILTRKAFVCVDEKKIVGMAIWCGRRLGTIVVDKYSKSHGVGSLLLKETEPENPWAITVGDEKVINFYIKNGYIVTGRGDKKVKLEKLSMK